jgi:ankyrin repeat protein
MHLVQYLDFNSYKQTVNTIKNHTQLLKRIRLHKNSLHDDSFVYIALNGHYQQFIRFFTIKSLRNISVIAKNAAFAGILKNGHRQEMICELLKDACVNISLILTFKHIASGYIRERGTILHWACMHGHIEVVSLLLKYDNVDFHVKLNGYEPIHFAVIFGHIQSYSF